MPNKCEQGNIETVMGSRRNPALYASDLFPSHWMRSIAVAALSIIFLLCTAVGESKSEELHIQLDARFFVESCASSPNTECNFPIFLSIKSRATFVCPSTLIPSDMCAVLPAQLTSQVLSILNGRFRKSCAETALWNDVRAAIASHSERTGRIEVAELSSSFVGCMNISRSEASDRRIFLLFEDGRAPGLIDCDASSSGHLFCNLYFSHTAIQKSLGSVDSSVPSLVDRVEIFSLRLNQIEPFLLLLSSTIQNPSLAEHREILDVPSWFRDFLNKKFDFSSVGEL